MNTLYISLDVSKQPNVAPVVRVGQGDLNGTNLVVNVLDHGDSLTVNSYDASLLIKFDESTMYDISGTTSGSQATFTINAQDMEPGRTRNAYVSIDGGSFVLSTSRFDFEVLKGVS